MKRTLHPLLILLLLLIAIPGCAPQQKFRPAPVVNGWRQPAAGRNAYIVQRHDTLYSIAWAFGMDYRDLAQVNHLAPPYSLKAGQRIYIVKPKSKKQQPKFSSTTQKFLKQSKQVLTKTVVPAIVDPFSNRKVVSWRCPAAGKIVGKFNNKLGGNKGIDIVGRFAEPVYATAAGRVVYSGTGIRSYGNLIIIKHNDDYLSAYAYNKRMLVHEGQIVKQGEKIAEMGKNDAGATMLHFEIRRSGKPINPICLIGVRS